jgi:hypothetical protein
MTSTLHTLLVSSISELLHTFDNSKDDVTILEIARDDMMHTNLLSILNTIYHRKIKYFVYNVGTNEVHKYLMDDVGESLSLINDEISLSNIFNKFSSINTSPLIKALNENKIHCIIINDVDEKTSILHNQYLSYLNTYISRNNTSIHKVIYIGKYIDAIKSILQNAYNIGSSFRDNTSSFIEYINPSHYTLLTQDEISRGFINVDKCNQCYKYINIINSHANMINALQQNHNELLDEHHQLLEDHKYLITSEKQLSEENTKLKDEISLKINEKKKTLGDNFIESSYPGYYYHKDKNIMISTYKCEQYDKDPIDYINGIGIYFRCKGKDSKYFN